MSNLKVHFSSATDDWATPQATFDELNKKYGPLELDVCADPANRKCATWLGQQEIYFVDGLSVAWTECYATADRKVTKAWMNPPYGRTIGLWVKKAYEESQKGCLVCCLLPARTDTKWFHEYCTKGEIVFLKGWLKFGNAKNSAPFPSMVVIFRPTETK